MNQITTMTLVNGIALEALHLPGDSARAPLVFLHEGLGSVAMWRQRGQFWPEILGRLSGRTVWVYSRRGDGLSDPVADVRGPSRMDDAWHIGRHEPDYMHREALEVLPVLLKAWGLPGTGPAPILIGHSDGATIGLLHASEHRLSGCVAMAPHLFVEPVAIEAIRAARQAYQASPPDGAVGKPPGLRQRLAKYHQDVDNAFWQWNDVWLSPAFARFDIRTACTRITTPLLALQGAQDEYGTRAQIEAVQQAAPQAQLLELPDCGHSPHRDQPETLTAAVLTFLAALP